MGRAETIASFMLLRRTFARLQLFVKQQRHCCQQASERYNLSLQRRALQQWREAQRANLAACALAQHEISARMRETLLRCSLNRWKQFVIDAKEDRKRESRVSALRAKAKELLNTYSSHNLS